MRPGSRLQRVCRASRFSLILSATLMLAIGSWPPHPAGAIAWPSHAQPLNLGKQPPAGAPVPPAASPTGLAGGSGSKFALPVPMSTAARRRLRATLGTPTTWYVATTGSDFNDCLTPATACQTINAAIGSAFAGDSIVVAAGTYYEHVFTATDLTITGAGSGNTIIDAQNTGIGLAVADGATLSLSGVTIEHGSPEGINAIGAVHIDATTVSNSDFGIAGYSQDVVVSNSLIADSSSYGIYDAGNLSIVGSTVVRSGWDNINVPGSTISVVDSSIGISRQAGINVYAGGSAYISGSTIWGNQRAGVNLTSVSTPPSTIIDSTISGNPGYGVSLGASVLSDPNKTSHLWYPEVWRSNW